VATPRSTSHQVRHRRRDGHHERLSGDSKNPLARLMLSADFQWIVADMRLS